MARMIPALVSLHLDEPEHQRGIPGIETFTRGSSLRLVIPIGSFDSESQGDALKDIAKICVELSRPALEGSGLEDQSLGRLAQDFHLSGIVLSDPYDEVAHGLLLDPVLEVACVEIESGPAANLLDFGIALAKRCMTEIRANPTLATAIELTEAEPFALGLFGFDWGDRKGWSQMMKHVAATLEAKALRENIAKPRAALSKPNSI